MSIGQHNQNTNNIVNKFVIKIGKYEIKKDTEVTHVFETNIEKHIKENIICVHKINTKLEDKQESRSVCGESCTYKPTHAEIQKMINNKKSNIDNRNTELPCTSSKVVQQTMETENDDNGEDDDNYEEADEERIRFLFVFSVFLNVCMFG